MAEIGITVELLQIRVVPNANPNVNTKQQAFT